ncbi:MerR family transcriptional regulator [Arthrobacter echini]|uniref:MerR family transcriptional regulator n=1 Tax=Arthrobacter echini TaxID=1529066 RepID=A0A4S5EA53_9MICC|nr:helix-turn-helix transcriptional regulator [Arthrobacter echini]THJ68470.1 MerR family transcriptional regulator [Arthrobacter echini]
MTGCTGDGRRTAVDPETPIYVISVAAELAEMHPQTLRQYDRMGLVTPSRTAGRGRRYSPRDVSTLREIQRLSQEGVSLEGIRRILELENHVSALQSRIVELAAELAERRASSESGRVFAAGLAGDVVTLARGQRPRARSQALVVWRPGASRSSR